jgi:alkylation response protein AidB-like acyl-CoA dehydrogenase
MAFQLTSEQTELQRSARRFVEQHYPMAAVRRIRQAGGHSPDLHQRMAALGWLAIGLPEEHGGAGGDVVDLVVLYEELGHGLVPGAHATTQMAGQVLLTLGTREQRATLLPAVAAGGLLVATGPRHPAASPLGEPAYPRVTMKSDADGVLTGTSYFVPYGAAADYLLVLAEPCTPDGRGADPRLFLVDARQEAARVRNLATLTGEPAATAEFSGAHAEAVGPKEDPRRHLNRSALLGCAAWVGAAQRLIDTTLVHLRQRVQYGRPLGSFQALQYRMLDLVIEVDHARLLTYHAAALVRDGTDDGSDLAMAQLSAAQAYAHVADEAVHLHGGYGVAMENDLALFYLQSKDAVASVGPPDDQYAQVAQFLHDRAVGHLGQAGG